MTKLSHLNEKGQAQMVDISSKEKSERVAIAKGRLLMKAETLAMIDDGSSPKGDVIAAARIAGIMAAKKTSDLIPLCHPINLSKVSIDFEVNKKEKTIEITAEASLNDKTGVEMEALMAVSVAALTLYDMLKAVDRGMVIENIHLTYKAGGKSGIFKA